ncbi:amidase signature enzyme [Acephala macrosclerotiorum]|nr:amidase signature enzyme [Acephala macrosclerotiorum]
MDVEELTIAQVHEGFASGKFTRETFIKAILDRIEKYDKTSPKIHSTLALPTTTVKEAALLDQHFQTHGKFKGSLHGIPILKLKDGGAVILGKTAMPDWATAWFSASSITNWEFTHNPYKLGHDVANFAILGVAEDMGGSIRCPASFTNLVGIRYTPGLIGRTGFCPLVKAQDTPGAVARTVKDCALMLDCLVGFDPKDEWTAAAITASKPKGGSYAAQLDPKAITKAKMGVISSLFGPHSDPACKAVNSVVAKACSTLEAVGTEFIDIELPGLKHYMDTTAAYVVRSRSDINGFLATKPSPPRHSINKHGLEALAFPDVQIPPQRHEDCTNERFPTRWDFLTNTLLASQARIPAVSVPVGFTKDDLPVGLELVSQEYREQDLLELASGVCFGAKGSKAGSTCVGPTGMLATRKGPRWWQKR